MNKQAMNKQAMADNIIAARRTGKQTIMELPDPAPTMADAMDIQALVFEGFGSPSVGWKVGATNEGAQKAFGINTPFYGPMAESGVRESGGEVANTECVGAVEPEYAFKMARDFPGDGEELNAENAASAIADVHVAIEVIGRCIGSQGYQNGIGVTMDFGGNAAFIIGPRITAWRDKDLVNTKVDVDVDGEHKQSGDGTPIMGDPINSILWLAQKFAEDGRKIKAGEWVSTGTCTPPVPAETGKTTTAKFGDLGTVSVTFTQP